MKFSSLAVAALLTGFAYVGTAAAQTAAPAPTKPAPAAAPAGPPLTAEQAKKICDTRFKDNAKKHGTCMKRHQKKIGKPIGKGDAKTLSTGK